MIDFRQYCSAFQLVTAGLNPYQPEVMFAFRQSYFGSEMPMMMWNPAGLLVLFAPILVWPYEISSILWVISSIAAYAVSSYLLIRTFQSSVGISVVIAVSAPSFWDCISLGQI